MEQNKNPLDGGSMTIGDLCEAISDQELPATLEGGFYVVSRLDIKRFRRTDQEYYRPLLIPEIAEDVVEPLAS